MEQQITEKSKPMNSQFCKVGRRYPEICKGSCNFEAESFRDVCSTCKKVS